jgi:peptidyl-prolyl cis-trans isomerase A (cyclophilin A)
VNRFGVRWGCCYTLREMKNLSVSLLAVAAIAVPILAQQPAASKHATSKPAATTSTAAKKPTAASSATTSRALLNPALLKAKAPDVFKARFTTTKGDFVVEVHRDWSPLGADRFYNLVKNGFFNNAHFFRVVSGFVVQFGLSPSPAVNKAWKDADIQDDPVKQTNSKGSITFATSGPNTRTTQLFINLGENARLDGMGFSPFGTVIEGMDVVEKFYTGYGEAPDQGQIEAEGNAYLDRNFPLLDSIKVARVVVAPAAQPAAKKATSVPAKAATVPSKSATTPAKK